MTEPASAELVAPSRPLVDEAHLAAAGFLARYSAFTRAAYTADMRWWFCFCADHALGPLAARGSTSSCGPARRAKHLRDLAGHVAASLMSITCAPRHVTPDAN